MKNRRILDIETVRKLYPYQDPVHGFEHIQRVYKLCQVIGKAEGADADILLTAALLHDCDGSDPTEKKRGEHHELSADKAGKLLGEMGWDEADIERVTHCIRAHRFRKGEEPQTIEAKVLFDADKLDVIGAIGIARTIGYAVQAGEPIYFKPSSKFIESGELEDGEHHSVYHEYLFKLSKVQGKLYTKTGQKMALGRHGFLEKFFTQLEEEVEGKR